MSRTTALTICTLALFSQFGIERIALAVQQGATAAPAQHWSICWVQGAAMATDRGIRTTMYVSGVVPSVRPNDVGEAFARFIDKTMPLPPGRRSTSRCVNSTSPAEVQKHVRMPGSPAPAPGVPVHLDCTLWNPQCVMTDWTDLPAGSAAATISPPPAAKPCGEFGWKDPRGNCSGDGKLASAKQPVTTAPVAPAPIATAAVKPPPPASNQPAKPTIVPAPAPPVMPYAFCWAGIAGKTPAAYLGAPFAAPEKDVPAWSAAYKDFLSREYQFAGNIRCDTLSSLAAAQKRTHQLADQLRVHRKVVETGWTYK